jgi:hypothetical protein
LLHRKLLARYFSKVQGLLSQQHVCADADDASTIIEPLTINKNEEKINSYCYQHRETTVMDAVKNVLGFDK